MQIANITLHELTCCWDTEKFCYQTGRVSDAGMLHVQVMCYRNLVLSTLLCEHVCVPYSRWGQCLTTDLTVSEKLWWGKHTRVVFIIIRSVKIVPVIMRQWCCKLLGLAGSQFRPALPSVNRLKPCWLSHLQQCFTDINIGLNTVFPVFSRKHKLVAALHSYLSYPADSAVSDMLTIVSTSVSSPISQPVVTKNMCSLKRNAVHQPTRHT